MATLAELVVKIGADVSNLTKGLDTSQKKIQSAADKMSGMGRTLTASVTLPIVALAAASIKMASDLNESMNKVQVAFKDAAPAVEEWAGNTLKNFGLAKGTALDMAAGFGDMATSMGLSTAQAATMSTSMVGLAADLSSFKNISIDIANTALTGVFTGETESLKQLGIVMTQANLQEYALSQGIRTKIQDMNQAQQTMLRYSYVMEMTKNAQGDFVRTSDGAANQMRVFQESVKELGATLGQKILPVFTPIVVAINKAVQAFSKLDDRVQKIIIIFAAVVAIIGPLILIAGALSAAIAAISLPVVAVVAGIGLLIAAGIALAANWDKVKAKALIAWSGMKTVILYSAQQIVAGIAKITDAVGLDSVAAKARKAQAELGGLIGKEVALYDQRSKAANADWVGIKMPKMADLKLDTNAFNAANAGNSAAKAAQDTKAAWESTAEALHQDSQIISDQYAVMANAAMMAGNKQGEFKAKAEGLTQQISKQQAVVNAVQQAYGELKAQKTVNIEEADKLRARLAQEQKTLSELQVELYDNKKAMEDNAQAVIKQRKAFEELATEIVNVQTKYKDDLASALADYQSKVKAVNSKLADDEDNLTKQYENNLTQRAQAYANFTGLFEAVTPKEVSGQTLLSNLQSQLTAMQTWSTNLNALSAKGIDQGLLAELRAAGPSAASEIAALNTLSAQELNQYVAVWQEKSSIARMQATAELEMQRQETMIKIQELQQNAAIELEKYRQEWETKNLEIRKNTEDEVKRIAEKYNGMVADSTTKGQQFVVNFAKGMESQFASLMQTVAQMGAITGGQSGNAKIAGIGIPAMASGGIVTSPTLALIGEAGPEAVVPLGRGRSLGSGGNNITININGAQDPEAIWRYMERKLVLKGVG